VTQVPPINDIPGYQLTDNDKAALRTYLQRCEVRLSTMHRVVTAFVSGAALMVLIPVFFKDVIGALIQTLLNDFGNRFPAFGVAGVPLTIVLYLLLAYVFGLSVFVPLRALYLLFKDILDFYITVSTPDTEEAVGLHNPAFALTGVAISPDEVSDEVRRDILRYQYRPNSIDFMLPFSDKRRQEYFQPILDETRYIDAQTQTPRYRIIPPEREIAVLQSQGVLMDTQEDYLRDVTYFNVALGVGRSYQRSLVREAAKTEMSLVRHGIYLRRLIFRYVATLMLFLWTLMVLFVMLAVLQTTPVQTLASPAAGELFVIAAGCFVWTLPLRYILHRPMQWIYRPLRSEDNQRPDAGSFDPQLNRLERALIPYHAVAVVASVAGLVAAALAVGQGG
jgi:hypothetical protein